MPTQVCERCAREAENKAGRANAFNVHGGEVIIANAQHIIGQIESNYDEITDSFDSMNLKSELLRGSICSLACHF